MITGCGPVLVSEESPAAFVLIAKLLLSDRLAPIAIATLHVLSFAGAREPLM